MYGPEKANIIQEQLGIYEDSSVACDIIAVYIP